MNNKRHYVIALRPFVEIDPDFAQRAYDYGKENGFAEGATIVDNQGRM